MSRQRDPRTAEEWQEAVDQAEFFLLVESARLYGLITTDLKIDAERCIEIRAGGRRRRDRAGMRVEQ